ncbi:MAG: type II methionyl aminopeptidase [Candidatus Methanoperedens sp.]|nr:type II methionyl aminopeptidase [Candidatus Methanoperedens sp.]
MNYVVYEKYLEAGKIAAGIRQEVLKKVREGTPLLEVAEYVEQRTYDLGGKPAFPCNISVNEVASHYTPEDYIPSFKNGDVVKVDIGVHVDGYIADTASTVEVGTVNHRNLIRATEEALENAISVVKDKIQTRTVGKVIEQTIKKHGFNPVKDLTGHNLEHYNLHAGITLPNQGSLFSHKIKKDTVIAIEPFATYGKGNIIYGESYIFALGRRSNDKESIKIKEKFGLLPFSKRWIPGINIEKLSGLKEYSKLIESSGKIVAQAEHTVIVNEDGCEIITG